MTCIVGLIHQQKVYIGGDAAGICPEDLEVIIRKDKKVFQVGEFIMGGTSSFRMIQLLQYGFKPPEYKDGDIMRYMVVDFVNAVRTLFQKGGFMAQSEDGDLGGTFLVGFRGRLFTIQSDYHVEESMSNYAAVGCGQAYSLGALHQLEKSKLSPEKKVQKALESAVKFSGGVRPPFTILSI